MADTLIRGTYRLDIIENKFLTQRQLRYVIILFTSVIFYGEETMTSLRHECFGDIGLSTMLMKIFK